MTLEPTPMNTKQAGFTLVELIAVIVILGILAAVIVPRYLDITDQANDSASRAAMSEGISRVTQAYSKYIITVQNSPGKALPDGTAWAFATHLAIPAYLGGASVNIGDYDLSFSEATVSGKTGVQVALLKGVTPVKWLTTQYGGTIGANITGFIAYPD